MCFPPSGSASFFPIEEDKTFIERLREQTSSVLQEKLKTQRGEWNSVLPDEHVSRAVIQGLRQRGVDVLSVPEAGMLGTSDEEHLLYALQAGRVLFTQSPPKPPTPGLPGAWFHHPSGRTDRRSSRAGWS